VRIYSKNTLRAFWERHTESEQALRAWYREVEQADWATPAQVRERFLNASIVGNNRVVFRIRGNNYRLVVEIFYPGRKVFVRFIGTHAEYDRINAEEV
jgi:mRNA interferase HigB